MSALATPTATPVAERDALFAIDLDRFQGPLDLLLHLIKQQDIDIFDIPIARITRQFLVVVTDISADDLEGAGEFLEMAATLVRIKAQMLLPRPEGNEDEDPRAELVRRLLEYELTREVGSRLQVSEADRARRFGKGYVPARTRNIAVETALKTTWEEVFAAALLVTLPDPSILAHRVTLRPVAMEEKVDLILDSLRKHERVKFSSLVKPWKEKMHGVMTLLASLELGKRREVALQQSAHFEELWLSRGEGPEDLESADLEPKNGQTAH